MPTPTDPWKVIFFQGSEKTVIPCPTRDDARSVIAKERKNPKSEASLARTYQWDRGWHLRKTTPLACA